MLVPVAVGRTAVRVAGLTDSGLVVRLTRGRLWIGLLTALLVGIVAINVLALSFSASSSQVGHEADALERQNSELRAQVADSLSNERIQKAALDLGLVFPEPGGIRYLEPSSNDATVAARRLTSGELTWSGEYAPPVTASTAVETPAVTDPAAQDTDAATATPDAADPATAHSGGPGGGNSTGGAVAAP